MDTLQNGTQYVIPSPNSTMGLGTALNQFALLDLLIPGFSTITNVVSTTTGFDLTIYVPIIALIFAAYWVFNKAWDTIYRLLRKHFMTSAEIRIDDEMYNYVMGWIAVQPFSSRSRGFVAQSSTSSRSWYVWYSGRYERKDEDEDEEEDGEVDAEGLPVKRKKKEKMIYYTPGMGTHIFWWRFRPFLFHRYVPGHKGRYETPSESEEISISSFGRSTTSLKELLAECKQLSCREDRDKTLIYRGSSKPGSSGSEFSWTRSLSRVARPMSSVVMDESTKREVLEDVAEYLAPRTRRWYANRGIPYRRGYLLYGAPGTGKSSLSLALAGRFGLAIYIVSLNSPMMNEENLASLFSELPSRCVVLLEDIDTAGLTHTRDDDASEKVAVRSKSKSKKQEVVVKEETKGKISLSALLNVLDGVASQEGRVLIMTTNHLDKLDEALIRPGRVDMKIEFKLADRAMMAALFRSIYTKVDGDDARIPAKKLAQMKMAKNDHMSGTSLTSGLTSGLSHLGKKEDGKSKEDIDKEEKAAQKKIEEEKEAARIKLLAEDFADVVAHGEFSPAEVQGYLLKNKRDPERAIKGAAQWAVDTRMDKKTRKEKEEKEAKEKKEKEEKEEKEAKEKKEKEEKEEREKNEKEKEELKKKKKKKLTNGVKKDETSSEDD